MSSSAATSTERLLRPVPRRDERPEPGSAVRKESRAAAVRTRLPEEVRGLVLPAVAVVRRRESELREPPLATSVEALDRLLGGGANPTSLAVETGALLLLCSAFLILAFCL